MFQRILLASSFALGMSSATAATLDFTLNHVGFEVIDTTPGDGVAPSFSITSAQSLVEALSPTELHLDSRGGSTLPSYGPGAVMLQGILGRGTALRWYGSWTLDISAVDVDDGYDYDFVRGNVTVASTPSADLIDYYSEFRFDLHGTGGTYLPMHQSFASGFDMRVEDGNGRGDRPFTMAYSLESQLVTYSFPRPPAIPEPSTCVLLATGLAALGLVRKRKPAEAH